MIKTNKPNLHEGIYSGYEKSSIVIFGVPFDGTVSNKPGARFGPRAIRQEIDSIETYSPYQSKDMQQFKFCDLDDCAVSFGNTQRVLDTVKADVSSILKDGKKIIALGGEHLISLPVIEAFAAKYADLQVLHFDAHTDLRHEYLGEKLSHATVMRRVCEKIKSDNLWQFGIRSGTKEEFEFAEQNTHICKYDLKGLGQAIDSIGKKPVYVSVDLDILDPSVLCGTGTPEPGGIDFKQLLDGLLGLNKLNIVGADIVELAPHYDQSGASTAAACKILREILLLMS